MKINIDGQEVFELTEIQKKVIQNDLDSDLFEEDMKRRVIYVLQQKYERCFERLKKAWEPILEKKYPSIPTNKEVLAKLIFSQKEYRNKTQRKKIQ